MKRFLGLLCAALLAFAPTFATASVTTTGAGKTPSGGGGGYVGPMDVFASPKALFSLRAGSAAIAAAGTQPIIKLHRASDGETCDVLPASTGNLGLTANCSGADNGKVLTNGSTGFCDSTTCTGDTWYDQSGSSLNVSMGTVANQPTLVFNCLGTTRPCWSFNGTTSYFNGNNSLTATSQTFTVSAVAIRTGNFSAQSDIIADSSGIFFTSTPNQAGGWFGTQAGATASDSAWHAMQFVVAGASSVINVDGTRSTGQNFGVGSLSQGPDIGRQSSGQWLTGEIAEVGLWPTGFSSTDEGNMCHNQFVYFGTSTSC